MDYIPRYKRVFAEREEQQKPSGVSWLADQLGFKRQTVYNYVKGDVYPKVNIALRIAEILECTVEELYRQPD